MISEEELKRLIRNNPDSIVAVAYRLGRKEANVELAESLRFEPGRLIDFKGTFKDDHDIDEMIKIQQEVD